MFWCEEFTIIYSW